MEVESYSFGRIVVAGKTYTRDVIIFPDRVLPNWWRKEGHRLCLDDLKEVLDYGPEVLVIGTGYSGLMKVPDDVRKALEARGIEVIVKKTGEAWKTFNELLKRGKKVVAAFHLTC